MSCLARRDPVAAVRHFEEGYVDFDWGDEAMTPAQVSDATRGTLDTILDHPEAGAGEAEILSHPFIRMNVLAVRSRGPIASEQKALLAAGLVAVGAGNMLSRRSLGLFFERALFSDPRDRPPFAVADDLPIRHIPLTAANYRDAVMATSSIPIVMEGVKGIAGAPAGVYRDGGFTDYHFDMPFLPPAEEGAGEGAGDGIVLYPHFRPRMIPGWFDKPLKWRRPQAQNLRNVLLIAPSEEFIAGLPGGKIPDRGDFKLYPSHERVKVWKQVTNECQRLADEMADLLATGRIAERAEPFPG